MPNIPTPPKLPPTTQQINAVLGSVIGGTQTLLNADMKHYADLRNFFLKFYMHPIFQLVLGFPPQNTPTAPPQDNLLHAELASLRSTISALSVTVAGLQSKAKEVKASPPSKPTILSGTASAQGKGSTQSKPPTYASKATSPTRLSLVLKLGVTTIEQKLHAEVTMDLTDELFNLGHPDVKISATRYTKKGNLVVTAHHTTMQSQLNEAAHDITFYIKRNHKANDITLPLPDIKARANVKWSKILINNVPVDSNPDWGPWTPEECHRSLCTHNPSYTKLKVTQKPSWVRQPSSLQTGSHSSLVVAFEDPDGTARCHLLNDQQLYILRVKAKVKRWKEKPCQSNNNKTSEASHNMLLTVSRSNTPDVAMSEDSQSLTPPTPTASHKCQLHTTPTQPKTPSGSKKKWAGP